MNEIEKTRKLLFAIRMVRYDDVIDEIGLNLFSREAELTEPTLRLFQYSPNTLEELQPALMKCLNNKREVKSNSLEAILYAVINNLIPNITTINDVYVDISNDDIKEELKRITDGTDILNKDAFRSKELGEDITWSKIWQILKDKFRASTITIGTGPVMTDKDIEPFQKPPKESWNPIIPVEEFFTDDLSLSSHVFEESPCFPIVNIRYGETKTMHKYYCELHPDFESDFIETIERHCMETEPDIHREAILAKG